jgi:hypothetical protein
LPSSLFLPRSEAFANNARFDKPATSRTIAYSRVGVEPIRPPRRQAYAEFVSGTIEGVIVIGDSVEITAISAPGTRSGAFLQFNIGMPHAKMKCETIFATLDHIHDDTRRFAAAPGLRPGALYDRRSEYNRCSGVVPLSEM